MSREMGEVKTALACRPVCTLRVLLMARRRCVRSLSWRSGVSGSSEPPESAWEPDGGPRELARRKSPLAHRRARLLAKSLVMVLLSVGVAAGCSKDDRAGRVPLEPDDDGSSGGTNFLPAYPLHHLEPAWSRQGLIAYRDEGVICLREGGVSIIDLSLVGIYVLDPATETAQRVLGYGGQPTWSPDGTKLCFEYQRQIYSVGADGVGPRQLTSGGLYSFPRWSPRGDRILFDGVRSADSEFDLYTVDTLGARISRVCGDQPGRRSPSWFPDGSRIAFSMAKLPGLQPGIFALVEEGCATTRITTSATDDRDPACSPDGRWIAYTAVDHNTGGPPQLHVAAIDGSGDVQITTGGGSWPSWSPDSKKIVYVREDPSDSSSVQGVLWIYDLVSRSHRQLTFQREQCSTESNFAGLFSNANECQRLLGTLKADRLSAGRGRHLAEVDQP